MIALIQRVSSSRCIIEGETESEIGKGLLIFLGIEERDDESDVDWLVQKIVNMRIFSDVEGKMNLSCRDIEGELMVISQFTLHASTKKGNRPSFIKAARPEQAIPLYEKVIRDMRGEVRNVTSGIFGADMKIDLVNDGPVTIIIDSRDRK